MFPKNKKQVEIDIEIKKPRVKYTKITLGSNTYKINKNYAIANGLLPNTK